MLYTNTLNILYGYTATKLPDRLQKIFWTNTQRNKLNKCNALKLTKLKININ